MLLRRSKLKKLKIKYLMAISMYLIFMSLFLGSCQTYRELDLSLESIELDANYKVRTMDGYNHIICLTSVSDSTLLGHYAGTTKKIPRKDIQWTKKARFSTFKTFIVLPVSIATAGVGYFFLSLSQGSSPVSITF